MFPRPHPSPWSIPSGLGYSLVFGAAGAESIQVYLETRLKALLIGLPRCEDGQLPISDAPGHGLALIPGAEKKYRFTM